MQAGAVVHAPTTVKCEDSLLQAFIFGQLAAG